MTTTPPSRFACDAMLGSLARWLRAAGYDTSWQEGIADWDLIRQARDEGRILLSCDTGIFKIGIVRDGQVSSLQIPNQLSTEAQLQLVMKHFGLTPREPRCMACGGELREVPRAQVQDRVPPKSFAWAERFWQCESCGQPFWAGTHWQRINQVLEQFRAGGA